MGGKDWVIGGIVEEASLSEGPGASMLRSRLVRNERVAGASDILCQQRELKAGLK